VGGSVYLNHFIPAFGRRVQGDLYKIVGISKSTQGKFKVFHLHCDDTGHHITAPSARRSLSFYLNFGSNGFSNMPKQPRNLPRGAPRYSDDDVVTPIELAHPTTAVWSTALGDSFCTQTSATLATQVADRVDNSASIPSSRVGSVLDNNPKATGAFVLQLIRSSGRPGYAVVNITDDGCFMRTLSPSSKYGATTSRPINRWVKISLLCSNSKPPPDTDDSLLGPSIKTSPPNTPWPKTLASGDYFEFMDQNGWMKLSGGCETAVKTGFDSMQGVSHPSSFASSPASSSFKYGASDKVSGETGVVLYTIGGVLYMVSLGNGHMYSQRLSGGPNWDPKNGKFNPIRRLRLHFKPTDSPGFIGNDAAKHPCEILASMANYEFLEQNIQNEYIPTLFTTTSNFKDRLSSPELWNSLPASTTAASSLSGVAVDLDVTSVEGYKRPLYMFLDSLFPGKGIHYAISMIEDLTVHAVVNPITYNRFVLKYFHLRETQFKNKPEDLRVEFLLHGPSSPQAYDGIIKEGFSPERCHSGCLYGTGAYFSSTASYSDKGYTYTDSQGYRSMFAGLVIIGRTAVGNRAPLPPKQTTGEAKGMAFNSSSGGSGDPSVYCIPNSDQTVPYLAFRYKFKGAAPSRSVV